MTIDFSVVRRATLGLNYCYTTVLVHYLYCQDIAMPVDAVISESMQDELRIPISLLPRLTGAVRRTHGRYRFPDLPRYRGDHNFNVFIPPSYVLGNVIGDGEFATVKMAYNVVTKDYVAIKCFRPRTGLYKIMDEQILREMMVSKGLFHEHILRIHEAIMYGNRVFLVMEYCPYGDLRRYINTSGALTENLSRKFFTELCLGVRKMHSLNIVHRDLKLENLLIDGKFSLKIGDFGCARKQMDKQLNTVTGSYAYGAPELVRGDEYNGKKADVWSMGIILYAMIAGKLPYTDKGGVKVVVKKRKTLPKYPKDLSKECCDLISGMLTFEPSERLSLEAVISHPWLSIDL